MYYSKINPYDIANGPGVRVTLFVSGCRNRCPECFQPETWNFQYGEPFEEETMEQILAALAPSYIQGLTLLGGEPMEPENAAVLLRAVRRIRGELPAKDIWCFTGCLWENLTGISSELAASVDVLVDGPFVRELKDISLQFRGSSNQRILDMAASVREGRAVGWNLPEKFKKTLDM